MVKRQFQQTNSVRILGEKHFFSNIRQKQFKKMKYMLKAKTVYISLTNPCYMTSSVFSSPEHNSYVFFRTLPNTYEFFRKLLVRKILKTKTGIFSILTDFQMSLPTSMKLFYYTLKSQRIKTVSANKENDSTLRICTQNIIAS